MPLKSKAQTRAAYASLSAAKPPIPPKVAQSLIRHTPKTAYAKLPARKSSK